MASRPATHIINNWRAKRERTALLVVGDAPGVSVCVSLPSMFVVVDVEFYVGYVHRRWNAYRNCSPASNAALEPGIA